MIHCVSLLIILALSSASGSVNKNGALNQTAIFIDYAFALDNFNTLYTAGSPSNDTIREAIKAFTVPIRSYAMAQESNSNEKLTKSLLGLPEFLYNVQLQDGYNITDDQWKNNTVYSSVIAREQLQDVLFYRDTLMNMTGAAKDTDQLQALFGKQDEINDYEQNTFISATPSKLVDKGIDFKRFEEEYYGLVSGPIAKNVSMAPMARSYLAGALKTGSFDDTTYNTLMGLVATNETVANQTIAGNATAGINATASANATGNATATGKGRKKMGNNANHLIGTGIAILVLLISFTNAILLM